MNATRTALAVGAAAVLLLAGCSGSAQEPDGGSTPTGSRGSAVSAERCRQNEAAGKVTYVTGYQFQASASILDPIAAKALGYFDDVCLDVDIQPGTGETAQNAQLVAAGTAKISSIAGNGDVLVNVSNGVDVKAVAMFGHVPVATLMTKPDITDLKQLEGTTLGQKGALPVTIEAMLRTAGVDVAKVKQVTVGFDPTVLVRGQVQSLTGYKSNEPLTLAAKGEKITEWNPEDYGFPGRWRRRSSTRSSSPSTAPRSRTSCAPSCAPTPTASSTPTSASPTRAALSQAGYDTAHNVQVWQTETKLVDSSLPAGQVLGQIDDASARTEGSSSCGWARSPRCRT